MQVLAATANSTWLFHPCRRMLEEIFSPDHRIVILLFWESYFSSDISNMWYTLMSFLLSPDLSFIKMSKCWFLLILEFGQSPVNYYFKYLQKHGSDITFYKCILCISTTLSWCLHRASFTVLHVKCNVRKIWVMLRILCLLRQLIRCLIW